MVSGIKPVKAYITLPSPTKLSKSKFLFPSHLY